MPAAAQDRPVAVVTGASSGIGEATAGRLAAEGFDVVIGARRVERVQAVAERIGGTARPLDVTDPASVDAFCSALDRCDVLVNNAGGALGVDPVLAGDDDQWRSMFESNVLGAVRMTRTLLPLLDASGDGRIVVIGSIAGFESYPGGGGYVAAKHAIAAAVRIMRIELLGRPIRITEVAPGMVDTEFSTVRLGDAERAAAVYQGMTPLTADDIADVVTFAVTRPAHVNLDHIVVRPRDQATARDVHRADA
ncbi:MAG: SDR family NAD(P)-dependent oxidoreductase [Solirubrobacteraceae bacterium]